MANTNILQLPAFSPGTSFAIATNADWFDSIYFIAPGSPTGTVSMVGAIVNGSNVVNVPDTTALVPGLPITPIPGIEGFVRVGEITSLTQFKMVDQVGYPAPATINDAVAKLIFQPLPLDLSGIEFIAEVRSDVESEQVLLLCQTSDGTLVNGGVEGTLGFNVVRDKLEHLSARSYVMDIIARADAHVINLFPLGPCTVAVTSGVTIT